MISSVVLHAVLLAVISWSWSDGWGKSQPRRDVFVSLNAAPVMRRAESPVERTPTPTPPTTPKPPKRAAERPLPIELPPELTAPSVKDILDRDRANEPAPTGIMGDSTSGSQFTANGPGTPTDDGSNLVTFAGLSTDADQARSIVYVVDTSGPMVSSLPIVLKELQRSIQSLQPTQRFNVVLFGQTSTNDSGARAFSNRLLDANPDNLRRLSQWLATVESSGKSTPLAGLRAGLSMKPRAMFLLCRPIQRTGGGEWDAGADATLAELERLNPVTSGGGRATVIKIVQFLDPDPSGMLARIAQAHGGGTLESDLKTISRKELTPR